MRSVPDGVMAFEVRGLARLHGAELALDGVDLTLAPGEICCLLGPNGAGKSTLVRTALGLLVPTRGGASIAGVDVAHDRLRAVAHVGYASQDVSLYPSLTAEQNVRTAARLRRVPASSLEAAVESALDALALGGVRAKRVSTLSGGQQRRCHVAAAMVHQPNLLILDEPTAGVDVESRERILATVERLADGGTAVLYATHYFGEVERLDSRTVVLAQGRIVADARLASLIERHASPRLALKFAEPVARAVFPAGTVFPSETEAVVPTNGSDASTLELLRELTQAHLVPTRLEVLGRGLEDAYLHLTDGAPAREMAHE